MSRFGPLLISGQRLSREWVGCVLCLLASGGTWSKMENGSYTESYALCAVRYELCMSYGQDGGPVYLPNRRIISCTYIHTEDGQCTQCKLIQSIHDGMRRRPFLMWVGMDWNGFKRGLSDSRTEYLGIMKYPKDAAI